MAMYILTKEFSAQHRKEMQGWIRANGVDPGTVPIPNVVTIEHDHFEIDVLSGRRSQLVRPPHGRPYVARTTLAFDLIEPWPWAPDYSDWT